MDNLIERLKQANDESWETWFDRWYKKCDWEYKLIICAKKGLTGTLIAPDKKEEYTKRRILDERFIPKMKKMLGPNIEVSSQVESRKNIFGGRIEERFIVIKW